MRRLFLLALLAGLPAVAAGLALLWAAPESPEWLTSLAGRTRLQITLSVLLVGFWLAVLVVLRRRAERPLTTLTNVLSGLREGDYSFQARGASHGDPLAEVLLEVNALVETMREQRLGALETTALLRTVMAEIDVAVFAFDSEGRLRLVNRAGERLLGQPSERLQGRQASEIGLADFLEGEAPRTAQASFASGVGRWGLHRRHFRGGGLPHQLLVIADLSRELREEERLAWQRLVRVLGHELNNSLAPIKSIAGSLDTLLQREPLPADWRDDMRDGLAVIAGRAEGLNRFVGGYAQLARLPKPRPQPVAVRALVTRVVNLEPRLPVRVLEGPEVTLSADPDQLEQVLINLVRNAVDAVAETPPSLPAEAHRDVAGAREPPSVSLGWSKRETLLEIWVADNGPGLASTANLFVPFFTTKQKGSGIGLVLSRQIVEAHGGALVLENRTDASGCVARLRLPVY